MSQLREAIRAAGSNQLITVGQDEGGFQNRLTPAFFAPFVDFTTNHSWWQNDSLLSAGFTGRETAGQANADPGNRIAARIES